MPLLQSVLSAGNLLFPQRLPTDTGNLNLNLIRFYKQFGLFPQQSHHPGLLNVYILFPNSFFFFSLHSPHPCDFPLGKYFYIGEV